MNDGLGFGIILLDKFKRFHRRMSVEDALVRFN
jgi:hypothetical protein